MNIQKDMPYLNALFFLYEKKEVKDNCKNNL